MIEILFKGKKKNNNQEIIGYYDKQKQWGTKCPNCNSFDIKIYYEVYVQTCECNNCGKKADFDDDDWIHGYIGEEEHLIRVNGESYEVYEDSIEISLPKMIDEKGIKIFMNINDL